MEHFLVVWLLFFHKFIPAVRVIWKFYYFQEVQFEVPSKATGVHNNRQSFSIDNEQHDQINSFSQISFLLPCYIWDWIYEPNRVIIYLEFFKSLNRQHFIILTRHSFTCLISTLMLCVFYCQLSPQCSTTYLYILRLLVGYFGVLRKQLAHYLVESLSITTGLSTLSSFSCPFV